MTTILAIESSCDETAASVCGDGKILSNIIASQKVHEQYGGVVPELASRAHIQNIIPVVNAALQIANCKLSSVDAVAFTQSPGLIGSLLVGAQFAKSLALSLNKPLIAVHHMQAHVLANLIANEKPSFPFLCLTVSGGHTQIVLCESPARMKVLGETIDDAAGEAFDKSAKLLGLPYPGGPLIDKYARQGNPDRRSARCDGTRRACDESATALCGPAPRCRPRRPARPPGRDRAARASSACGRRGS